MQISLKGLLKKFLPFVWSVGGNKQLIYQKYTLFIKEVGLHVDTNWSITETFHNQILLQKYHQEPNTVFN